MLCYYWTSRGVSMLESRTLKEQKKTNKRRSGPLLRHSNFMYGIHVQSLSCQYKIAWRNVTPSRLDPISIAHVFTSRPRNGPGNGIVRFHCRAVTPSIGRTRQPLFVTLITSPRPFHTWLLMEFSLKAIFKKWWNFMITQMLQITRFSGIYLSSNFRDECSVKLRNDDGTFRDGKFSHFGPRNWAYEFWATD